MQLNRSVDALANGRGWAIRRGRRLARRIVRRCRRLRNDVLGGGAVAVRQADASRPAAAPDVDETPIRPQAVVSGQWWSDTGDLRLSGWVYLPGRDVDLARSSLNVWAEDDQGRSIPAEVTRRSNPEVDVAADDGAHSYAAGWFEAVFKAEELGRALEAGRVGERRLTAKFRYTDEGRRANGEFSVSNKAGSPGAPLAYGFDGGLFIRAVWDQGAGGMSIIVFRRSAVASGSLGSGGLHLELVAHGSFRPQRLRLAPKSDSSGPEFELEIPGAGSTSVDVPWDKLTDVVTSQESVFPLVVDAEGSVRHVHWAGVQAGAELWSGRTPDIGLEARPAGVWRISARETSARLTDVRLDPERSRLIVSGELRTHRTIDAIELVGATGLRTAELLRDGESGFRAELELIGNDRWGNADLMLPSGVYQLQLRGDEPEAISPDISAGMLHELDRRQIGRRVGCQLRRGSRGKLEVVLQPPLNTSERSKRGQCDLRSRFRATGEKVQDSVVFESYKGRFATCSPLAIMRRLVELDLGYRYYWAVRDFAVPVPESSTPVIIDSADWWRIRATSRFLVINGWAGPSFAKRPGQQVVQTFHGTPYKKLAADRTAMRATGAAAARRESSKWDHLVVQNDYMAERMASAYLYDGTILRTGYPRNDILSLPQGQEIRESMRRRLGIADDQLCVLYAPTLRENRNDLVIDLDLDQLVSALGQRVVLLVRGHYTMSHRSRELASRTVDVTTFPYIEELYLASDVAITDYSSIMFDYTAGGKPVLFFVPDLDEYASEIRGVYFDLAEIAPGPLLTTTDEVIDALRSLSQVESTHRDAYRAWQRRFNPWDDGHAAERVVDAVFAGSG